MLNSDARLRLATVMGQRERDKADALATQIAMEAATRKKEAQHEAAKKRWEVSKQEIAAAVTAVNAELAGTGVLLSVTDKQRSDAGLAQFCIKLAEDGDARERQLVLNISALGQVTPVALVPHSGPQISNFNIETAGKEFYETIIVDFIEMCTPKK